jgi:hypothetical protein
MTMAVAPHQEEVKPTVKKTTDGPEYVDVDSVRKGLRIVGTAYDINRISEACKAALRYYETEGADLSEKRTVLVQPPQENEP